MMGDPSNSEANLINVRHFMQSVKQAISLHPLIAESSAGKMGVRFKKDKTVVTELDLFISSKVKDLLSGHYPVHHFYCEENHSQLQFPAIILDPIDGTKEFVDGIPECALSLSICDQEILSNNKNNFSWIYNFYSGFEISSLNFPLGKTNTKDDYFLGLVSRTEWKKGKFNDYTGSLRDLNIELAPRGSIAFKLGLLASGACDFVVSFEPKNIWDIAAGTFLCADRGISFFHKYEKINLWEQSLFKDVPLIWCHESLLPKLKSLFK